MLSKKEKSHDLVWKYQSTKCEKIMMEIIRMNKGYINKLALSHFLKYKKMCEFQDLKQQCIIGLIRAVERFDFDKNVTLLSYADFWMRSEMFSLYSLSMPVHIPIHLLRSMLYTKIPCNVANLKKATEAMSAVSYDAFYSNGSKDVIVGNLPIGPDTTTILFERHHIPLEFEKAYDEMTPLQRDVINYVYLEYKLSEIVEKTEVPSRKISRALNEATKIIRKHLSENTHVPLVDYEAA